MSEATRTHKTTHHFTFFTCQIFPGLPALTVSIKALPAASVAMIPTVFSKLSRVFDVALVPLVLLGADVEDGRS